MVNYKNYQLSLELAPNNVPLFLVGLFGLGLFGLGLGLFLIVLLILFFWNTTFISIFVFIYSF